MIVSQWVVQTAARQGQMGPLDRAALFLQAQNVTQAAYGVFRLSKCYISGTLTHTQVSVQISRPDIPIM